MQRCVFWFFIFFTNHSTPWHFACRKVVPEHWFCHHEQDGAGGSAAGKKKSGGSHTIYGTGTFTYIYHQKPTIHVGKYTSPMDPSWASDPHGWEVGWQRLKPTGNILSSDTRFHIRRKRIALPWSSKFRGLPSYSKTHHFCRIIYSTRKIAIYV